MTSYEMRMIDWSSDVALPIYLGANDGLRGIDPATTRRNLARILDTLKERGIPTLLTGMLAPPNLGRDYGDRFSAIYPDLADDYDVAFYPFFLEGVATVSDLRSDEHTSELQSLMRHSYAVSCLNKKKKV